MRLALPSLLLLLPGVFLLLPRGPAGPPGLAFDPPLVRLGELRPGERRRLEIGWRRLGAGSLRVLELVPGCACLEVGGLPRELPPGARGLLALTVLAPSRPGPFHHGVDAMTDARRRGGVARATVAFEGWVEAPFRVQPEVLELGACSPGRGVRRTLSVLVDRSLDPRDLRADLVGLEGEVVLVPSPEGRRATLETRLQLPASPGALRAALRVLGPGGASVHVPVRAVVR